jgi:hypothetical protein
VGSDRAKVERVVRRAGGPREGDTRDDGPFPCLNDITVGPYLVSISIGTGEASIIYAPERSPLGMWVSDGDGWESFVDETGEVVVKRPTIPEYERAVRNLERSNIRAIGELRRYCVKNALLKMLTLTFAEPHWDREEVKALVNELFVRWRALKGGKKFPYAYVLELHPGTTEKPSHGLHVHVAVPLRYVDKHWLQETWGHGIVHYRDPKPLRAGNERDRARTLAFYLSKYISKDIFGEHEHGEHRYEVAQGFGVEKKSGRFSTLAEAKYWLQFFESEEFREVWASSEKSDWVGPPVWVFRSLVNVEGG